MALPALAAVRRAYAGRVIVIAARPVGRAALPLSRRSRAPRTCSSSTNAARRGRSAPRRRTPCCCCRTRSAAPGSHAWPAFASAGGIAPSGRGWLLTRGVSRPRAADRPLHHVEYYRALVKGLGIDPGDDAIPPSASAGLDAREGGRPARAQRHRAGPADRGLRTRRRLRDGQALAARVASRRSSRRSRAAARRAVLVGAAGDRDTGRAIESALPAGATAVNLIGRTIAGGADRRGGAVRARSCRMTRARCTSPRRSACR